MFGLVNVGYIGKYYYYVPFIDNASRYNYIYFMCFVSKFFFKFEEFKALLK